MEIHPVIECQPNIRNQSNSLLPLFFAFESQNKSLANELKKIEKSGENISKKINPERSSMFPFARIYCTELV